MTRSSVGRGPLLDQRDGPLQHGLKTRRQKSGGLVPRRPPELVMLGPPQLRARREPDLARQWPGPPGGARPPCPRQGAAAPGKTAPKQKATPAGAFVSRLAPTPVAPEL